jgi:hypothetical protein
MSSFSSFTFEPKLTLDGLMTLVAGIIAFAAILLQIRSSRKEVQRQLNAEKESRALEEKRQKEAVARALLFEIVNFYAFYRVYVRPFLDRVDVENCMPPTLSAPGSDFFAVYHSNAGRLGAFQQMLVEKVVQFYGLAELLLTNIRAYTWSLAREELQKSVQPGSAPRKLLHQVQQVMYPADRAAIEALQQLCEVAGVSFDSLKLPS